MAAATAQGANTRARFEEAKGLLDQILDQSPAALRVRVVADSISTRIETIRELLPDNLKGQAERFVKRAALTFSQSADLQRCTPDSFITCVLKAAEMGLAIDGKLAHAVPYGNAATFIADYKGILAVARRSGVIEDCWAEIVYEGDAFSRKTENGQQTLVHIPADRPGAKPLGIYGMILFPGGRSRFVYMTMEDLLKFEKDHVKCKGGPWAKDRPEMQKKTVIRRALKTYCEDAGVASLLDDSEEFEHNREVRQNQSPGTVASVPIEQLIQQTQRAQAVAPRPSPIEQPDLEPGERMAEGGEIVRDEEATEEASQEPPAHAWRTLLVEQFKEDLVPRIMTATSFKDMLSPKIGKVRLLGELFDRTQDKSTVGANLGMKPQELDDLRDWVAEKAQAAQT